jgi:hypothetical protein
MPGVPKVVFYPANCEVRIDPPDWFIREIEFQGSSTHRKRSIWLASDSNAVSEMDICNLLEPGEMRKQSGASVIFWIGKLNTSPQSWIKMHLEICQSVWKLDSYELTPANVGI